MINESQALSLRSPPPASTITDVFVKLLVSPSQSIVSPVAAAAEHDCLSSSPKSTK